MKHVVTSSFKTLNTCLIRYSYSAANFNHDLICSTFMHSIRSAECSNAFAIDRKARFVGSTFNMTVVRSYNRVSNSCNCLADMQPHCRTSAPLWLLLSTCKLSMPTPSHSAVRKPGGMTRPKPASRQVQKPPSSDS